MADSVRGGSLRAGTPQLWLEISRLDPTRMESWSSQGEALADLNSGDARGVRIDCLEVSARTPDHKDPVPHAGLSDEMPPDAALPDAELIGSGRASLRLFRRSNRSGVHVGEFLERIGRTVNLAVAADDRDAALAVVGATRRAGMLEHLWMTSADLAVLEAVRNDSPATRLLHSCDPAKEVHGPERHAATLREAGIEGVMVKHDIASAGLVALMHRFGCILGAHGAEYPRMVRACLAAGADVVCSPAARAFADL